MGFGGKLERRLSYWFRETDRVVIFLSDRIYANVSRSRLSPSFLTLVIQGLEIKSYMVVLFAR